MKIVDKIVKYLKEDNLFLTGGAGVGKSYLAKEIAKKYKNVITLGSSGISAVNINGQTIHSFFAFGISNTLEELEVFDRKNRHRIKEINKILEVAELIVIDEISMVSANLMDMILYRLRGSNFKGKVLVVGDFYQLPPVIKKSSIGIFDDLEYAFESSAWDVFDFKIVELTEVKRTKDKEFIKILDYIRVGELNSEVLDYLIMLKEQKVNKDRSTTLFGRNYEVHMLNNDRLKSINTQEITLKSIFQSKVEDETSKKVLNWQKSLPIVEELKIKQKAPVIFTTNKWGVYYNGERGVIQEIQEDAIIVKKDSNSKLVKVQRFAFEMNQAIVNKDGNIEYETVCVLKQYPIRLAYAITIHKSQGMSIDKLICNINHIFADSQLYVALSRGVDPKFLKIEYKNNDFQNYLKRVIKSSNKVKRFYEENKSIKID